MSKQFLKGLPVLGPALKAAIQKRRYLLHRREGEELLHRSFAGRHGRPVDVDNPTLFTEKVMAWLIRQHRSPDERFTKLADKLDSRDYVRERLGPEFLIELYWQGTDLGRIPFDDLPEHYVIKPSHASGEVILAGPELDRAAAIEEMEGWLTLNYYWLAREYQYLHMKPRILIEERVDDGTEGSPIDYSFWCFNGEAKMVQVRKYPRLIHQFHNVDWSLSPLRSRMEVDLVDVSKPAQYDEMRAAAERLAQGFEFVRVDLYAPPGRILFSELTFTPAAGRGTYGPEGWDRRLGDLWEWS